MSEKMSRRNFLKFSLCNGVVLSNLSLLSGLFEGEAFAREGGREGAGPWPVNALPFDHRAFWRTLEREFSGTLVPTALSAAGDDRAFVGRLLDIQKNAFVTLKTSSFSLLRLYATLQKEEEFTGMTAEAMREAQAPARRAIERMLADLRAVAPRLPKEVDAATKEAILRRQRELVASILEHPVVAPLLDEEGRTAIEELFARIEEVFERDGYSGLVTVGEEILTWSLHKIDGTEGEEMPLFIEVYLDAVLTGAFRMLETLCGWIPVPFFENLCVDFVNQAILSPILGVLIFSMFPTMLVWSILCPSECTEQQVLILNVIFVINAILAFLYALKVLYDTIFGEPINPAGRSRITARDVVRIVRLIEERW